MAIGLVGRKCGMTRIFNEQGDSIPVSVIELLPNRITQIKTAENDGYNAIQVTTGTRKANRVNKPLTGHYAAAKVEAGRGLWEFTTDGALEVKLGDEICVEHFENQSWVDVTGISKGKGFAGVVKRHNFATQDNSHGNSLSHRAPGSIGQNQTPGRVFKGKKMAGHMGNKQNTVQNLQVVKIDKERNLIMVKGGVPGAPGGDVIVKPAVKKPQQQDGGQ